MERLTLFQQNDLQYNKTRFTIMLRHVYVAFILFISQGTINKIKSCVIRSGDRVYLSVFVTDKVRSSFGNEQLNHLVQLQLRSTNIELSE